MEREIRYLVLKLKDVAEYLSEEEAKVLFEIENKVFAKRGADERGTLECVVVERDWPEYEETWARIAARVDGVPYCRAAIQQAQDYRPERKELK